MRLLVKSVSILLAVLCIMSSFFGIAAWAGEYYVAPRASAQENITDEGAGAWESAMDINNPCSAETAMAHAVAGDTVYFRGGTYQLEQDLTEHSVTYYWYNGALNPENSGTLGNPITFMAYPGELPIMDTATFSADRYDAPAFGCNYNSYITFDGFKLIANHGHAIGGIKMMGQDRAQHVTNIIIRNCIFYGGDTPTPSTTNWVGVFAQSTIDSTIENCTFYSIRQTGDWHNTAGVVGYWNERLTVRNCEFYDCSLAIFIKSDNQNTKVYNNYIHNCFMAIFGSVYLTISSDGNQIYNNVIADIDECGIDWGNEEEAHGNDFVVYNNTIYNIATKRGIQTIQSEPGHGAVIYNNIIDSPTDLQTAYERSTVSGYIKECDHNGYVPPLYIKTYNGGGSQLFTTLSAWQTSGYLEGGGNPGAGSLVGEPEFVNTSGTMSQLDDFRLASDSLFKGAGRNGVDMGANIDLVGVQRQGGVIPPPQKPATVQDFKLQ